METLTIPKAQQAMELVLDQSIYWVMHPQMTRTQIDLEKLKNLGRSIPFNPSIEAIISNASVRFSARKKTHEIEMKMKVKNQLNVGLHKNLRILKFEKFNFSHARKDDLMKLEIHERLPVTKSNLLHAKAPLMTLRS